MPSSRFKRQVCSDNWRGPSNTQFPFGCPRKAQVLLHCSLARNWDDFQCVPSGSKWVKEPWVSANGRTQCPMPSSKTFKVCYSKPSSSSSSPSSSSSSSACHRKFQESASSHFWVAAGDSAKSFAIFDGTFRHLYLLTMSLAPKAS